MAFPKPSVSVVVPSWLATSAGAEPMVSRDLLQFVMDNMVSVKVTKLEGFRADFKNRITRAISAQCENLGVPWRGDEITELAATVHLEFQGGGSSGPLHVTAVVTEEWHERLDRLFEVRECRRCGTVLFRGPHHSWDCDDAVVRNVMES